MIRSFLGSFLGSVWAASWLNHWCSILYLGCKSACVVMQVYAMPVYDMIEYQLVKRHIPNGFLTRLVYRTTYIVLVGFVAITLPFFGGMCQECLQGCLAEHSLMHRCVASLCCVQHDKGCIGIVCSKEALQCVSIITQACLTMSAKLLQPSICQPSCQCVDSFF